MNAMEPMTVSERDIRIARESSKALALLLQRAASGEEMHLRVCAETEQDEQISLPDSAARLLLSALDEMAKGNGVALLPVSSELTTQQAADLLRVSRPFLIKLLEAGEIPYRKVGTHRRVLYGDALQYAEREDRRREAVMQDLVAETERLGLCRVPGETHR